MSELLGSFGDNELSPECLNPTSKFLKEGGIFVPYSYTNYVMPLSSFSILILNIRINNLMDKLNEILRNSKA